MQNILIIGASGFVGCHLARALLAEGHTVRCLARTPSKIADLADAGCEVVQGDMSDAASVQRAMEGMEAVYISVHTLSPQQAATPGQDFMEVELEGLRNVVDACRTHGARRIVYVTSLGVSAGAKSAWLRERYRAEQFLITSGLDATVIRPGQIVGVGGHGFNAMVANARRAVSLNLFGAGRNRMRHVALSDLIYYLVGVRDEPRTFGQAFDVGGDDDLTNNQMTDVIADVLGRRHPFKLNFPRWVLAAAAPTIERRTGMPPGGIKGMLDSVEDDGVGDPTPIRAILPRPPLAYRAAVEQALAAPR